MFGLGVPEMLIVGALAVLLFGSRLPEVARSMGRSFTEFKKGVQGLEDGMRDAVYSEPVDTIDYDDQQGPSGPAFEPPPAGGDTPRPAKPPGDSPDG
ncbi:MAG: twin-arginine translocase TatA/TatE family subunit [Planctomycetota bacterium]